MGVTTDFPYVTMCQSALKNLKRAQQSEQDRFHNCMSAIMFSAFALEGYLNFLGETRASDWDEYERKRPKEKMNELGEVLGYTVDWGRRPLQSFGKAFFFRNFIAHSKTVSAEWGAEDFPPEQEWQTLANLKNAERIVEDTKSLIEELHELAGLGEFPWFASKSFSAGK